MKTKVFFVDDEYLAIQEMTWMMKDFESFEIVGHATHADEAIQKINALQPDVLFLDIQLPEKSGLAIVDALEYTPRIVFVTAFDQYAIQVFEINAVDYLMKPLSHQRLVKCLSKMDAPGLPTHAKLFVKSNDAMKFISVADIRCLESIGNCVRIHHNNGAHMIYRSLSSLEVQIKNQGFFRANRKEMFNTHCIAAVHKNDATWTVVLNDQKEIVMSQRQASKFMTTYKKEIVG